MCKGRGRGVRVIERGRQTERDRQREGERQTERGVTCSKEQEAQLFTENGNSSVMIQWHVMQGVRMLRRVTTT